MRFEQVILVDLQTNKKTITKTTPGTIALTSSTIEKKNKTANIIDNYVYQHFYHNYILVNFISTKREITYVLGMICWESHKEHKICSS